MAGNSDREIIVIKKKIEPEAHGGSAWKVAYADFVTAMMAFFLLLWLLNATTEEQKQGLSNYFEPVGATSGSTGSGGVFGGISATDPGPIEAPGQTTSKAVNVRTQVVNTNDDDVSRGDPSESIKMPNQEKLPNNSDESRQMSAAKIAIQRSLEQIPELLNLYKSVAIDETREGLRIRLMDREKQPLFDQGGIELNEDGKKLVKVIYEVISRMPNKIQVSGHTSRNDEAATQGLSNWKISIQRAYAGREALVALGTPDKRFAAVRGNAERAPLHKKSPKAVENRRIEVTLLRRKPKVDPKDLIPPSLLSPN